jgi:CDP-glucose 4,6-dehydratase
LKKDPKLDPCYTTPSHFLELDLHEQIAAHVENDVRFLNGVEETINRHKPDFIFHLAAQPLVLRAYAKPHLTVETNLVGTLNLLEAVRRQQKQCILIMITTDKVYEDVGWVHSYRETDSLGGHDPYSASKACAEHVISSYWRSFFAPAIDRREDFAVAVAPVRGGNVIGGGDWAENRIVPDAMRALAAGKALVIRNRHATRPWQHVLELLSGYLHLGCLIYRRRKILSAARSRERNEILRKLKEICSAFNFGPFLTSNKTVGVLVQEIFKHWPGTCHDQESTGAAPETGMLNLTIDKAFHLLGWQPKWSFEETIHHTVTWYRQFYESAQGNSKSVRQLTQSQIREYSKGLAYSVND